MRTSGILVVSATLGAAACNMATGPTASGKFALTQLTGLSARVVSSGSTMHSPALDRTTAGAAALQTDFDLGPIKNTQSFFFLLANVGETSITEISLESSNPAFEISPSTIDELQPGTELEIVPIVRVTAVHGTSSSGVGFAPLLPQGGSSTTVSIRGTTGTETVGLQAEIGVAALVMDITLVEGTFTIPDGLARAGRSSNNPFAVPRLISDSLELRLRNSGNVDIVVVEHDNFVGAVLIPDTVLVPGGSLSLVEGSGEIRVEVSSGGTISDPDRLPLQPDGRAVFVAQFGTLRCGCSASRGSPSSRGDR